MNNALVKNFIASMGDLRTKSDAKQSNDCIADQLDLLGIYWINFANGRTSIVRKKLTLLQK